MSKTYDIDHSLNDFVEKEISIVKKKMAKMDDFYETTTRDRMSLIDEDLHYNVLVGRLKALKRVKSFVNKVNRA